jgi:hypothetical protein
MNIFDIVIPVGPNDFDQVEKMINYTIKNIINYRNIYVITSNINIDISNCILIDENIFPFNINSVAFYHGNNHRNGWYLQQLIKLYAGFFINGILNDYLVIDCDTFFLKPTLFFDNNKPLYNIGTEYHVPYFDHMKKLHPTLTKQFNISGICHHMMFQKHIINDLFNLINNYHKKDFWKVFLELVDKNEILGSGASEYEIYFNFLCIYKSNEFIVRRLQWANCSSIPDDNNLDYVSCHHYMR